MEHLTEAVERAVQTGNWYAALMVALTLPDIAAWVDDPTQGSTKRYASWVERYLSPGYTALIGSDQTPHKFLSGNDCYALRCALLHEGRDDTSQQRAADVLARYQFLAPLPVGTFHRNQVGPKLQLQVDLFCRDMCASVRTWRATIAPSDTARLNRLAELATIQTSGPIRI